MYICTCGDVKHIKEQIQIESKIKPEFQRLSINGKLLDDKTPSKS